MPLPTSAGSRALARRLLLGAAAAIALLLAVEIAVRAAGVADFPLYVVDPEIGYHYAPRQSGTFLNRNSWFVNDRAMPTARDWQPDVAPDLLVIGNSIVAGGNPYDHAEKLAPLLQRAAVRRYAVWPVATGGWSSINQMAYLDRHPDVVAAADAFVWSHTLGGFGGASPWLGDDVFPRSRPASAAYYVLHRRLVQSFGGPRAPQGEGDRPGSGSPPTPERYAHNLARFDATLERLARATNRRYGGVLLLYPTADQLAAARRGAAWIAERPDLERVAARHGVRVVDLAAYPQWNERLYRDGVHPTVEGNALLARILMDALDRTLEE